VRNDNKQRIRNWEDDSVKELLRFRTLSEDVKNIQYEIEEMHQLMISVQAIRYDAVKVQGGSGEHPLEKATIKLVELLNRLEKKKREREKMLYKINKKMSQLLINEQMVLKLYYMDGLDIYTICDNLNYTYRQILRIKKSGLENYKKIA